LEYRPFGRTGVKVSQMCLGTMMFGGRADKKESLRIIDHAMDRGVNFVDTANVYAANESERIVGEALARDGKRQRTILAVPPCRVAVRYYDRANGLDLRPHLQRVV